MAKFQTAFGLNPANLSNFYSWIKLNHAVCTFFAVSHCSVLFSTEFKFSDVIHAWVLVAYGETQGESKTAAYVDLGVHQDIHNSILTSTLRKIAFEAFKASF